MPKKNAPEDLLLQFSQYPENHEKSVYAKLPLALLRRFWTWARAEQLDSESLAVETILRTFFAQVGTGKKPQVSLPTISDTELAAEIGKRGWILLGRSRLDARRRVKAKTPKILKEMEEALAEAVVKAAVEEED